MTATTRILSRLCAVHRRSKDCWIALCPAHDDHSPSLSMRRVSDRVLIRCWAGCTAADITAALGLTLADLFDHGNHSRRKPIPNHHHFATEGLERWRDLQLQVIAKELRARDSCIAAVDEFVKCRALTESDGMELLALPYHGCSELEWKFERLRLGSTRDVLEVWRNG